MAEQQRKTPDSALQKRLTVKYALILAAALVLAWALDRELSEVAKFGINLLLLGAGCLPDTVYRLRFGKWPPTRHPAGYLPMLGWLAVTCVWGTPSMRAEYLPPSRFIDAALICAAAAILTFVVRGMAKNAATLPDQG